MKFDIWTFIFQTINFVALLFILKRLLYKPIRDILQKRRDLVRESIEKAENMKAEALELRRRNEEELKKIGEQRSEMTEKMKSEVMEEKKRLMGEAEKEAATRIEKATALLEMEKTAFEIELKEKAVETVSIFSSNLLRDIADEELHRGICRKFQSELELISRDIADRGLKDEMIHIEVVSAYPVPEEELAAMRMDMEMYLSRKVMMSSSVDGSLIAGLRIRAHDMVYDSSISGQISTLAVKLKECV
jgi:F-type H+-transporting ATPase subunit b